MAVLSVRELNANISRVLARVEAGETIEISRSGRIIAELRPKKVRRDAAWLQAYEESARLLANPLPLGIGKIEAGDKYDDAAL